MKKMKKWMAVFLTCLMLVPTLAACKREEAPEGNTGNSNAAGNVNTNLKGTVDIFQFKVEINDALKAATETYMKTHPNVKINLETVGGGSDYGAALRTKMQNVDQPEIYNVGGPQDVKDWISNLEDLSGEGWTKHVVEGLLDDVTQDGKVYGMPYAIEGYGFVYNKDIFEAAGIDASKLKTYDEIDKAFGELKSKIDKGELKDKFPALEAVLEFPVKEKWVTGLHTGNIALGQEFDSNKQAYESKTLDFKYASQLKDLIDLQVKYTKHANNPAALNAVDYSMSVGGGLAIGRVAAVQQGNWIYPEVKEVDQKLADRLGMIPIPLKGVSEGNIPVGVPMYWCVNSKSSDADKACAKDFLNWLYQSEEGKKIVVEEFNFIPAYTNYGDIKPKDPLGATVNEYANAGKTAPWVFMGEPTGWGENTLGASIQSYVSKKTTWDKLISDAKAKWASDRK